MVCSAHEEKGNGYEVLVGKPDGKISPGRSRYMVENNIKTDVRQTGWGGVD